MPIFNFSRRPNVYELKAQKDVEGLIEALEYEEDHNVRLAAATALGKIGDSNAVKPLIQALEDSPRICEAAALALGEISDQRAVEPLIKTLEQENWEVRSQAAKALGKIGDQRAVKPLIFLLEQESGMIRWYAFQALEAITGESHGEDIDGWKQLI